jgi:surface protein
MCARTDFLHSPPLPLLRPHPFPKTLQLTEADFKEATWDWAQSPVSSGKWGDIGDWDVSAVEDFSYAFSIHRDEAGGTYVENGNPKAATFVGTAISKWITASATILDNTFNGASAMNADLSTWNVAKVTTLENTFRSASRFAGAGLPTWKTTAVTSLKNIFRSAALINADLSGWSVVKVTTMKEAFYGAEKFTGGGLNVWKTTALTDLNSAFDNTREMNTDLGGWNVAKVTSMMWTFKRASKFIGTGLGSWDTSSVTTLRETFHSAAEMNVDLSGWNVAKVTILHKTFSGTSKFTGTGVDMWDVSKVTDMDAIFDSTTSLTTCNKRKIADTWKSSAVFVATTYDTDWAADVCTVVRFEYRATR